MRAEDGATSKVVRLVFHILPEKMTNLGLIVLVCVLVFEQIDADDHPMCADAPNCPLFPNQNVGMVTLQDLQQKVKSKHWIMIYYSNFTTHQGYGKCNFRWNAPDSDNNVHKELMCYNSDWKDCEDFQRTVKRTANECSRAREDNVVLNSTMDGVFYSQDLDQYFWYDSCYDYNNASQCTRRYLDLLVSKTRYPSSTESELSLQELPWHLIASDLKNHFDIDFSDERMKFSWDGPECGFDGKIIQKTTSSASRGGWDFIVVFIVLINTFLF